MVWGADTGVGKTLVSAGLAAAATRASAPLLYLKPVQTGYPEDSDARLVASVVGCSLSAAPHAAALTPLAQRSAGDSGAAPAAAGETAARTLFAWRLPASPHLAVAREGRPIADAEKLGPAASAAIWWPFTQHATLAPGGVTVVDARCGEHLAALRPDKGALGGGGSSTDAEPPALDALYDGCASWWTQGVNAELAPRLAAAVAAGAARYGHVMHPEVAIEPALTVARRLLDGPGAGWAARVFFSDDGSTAVEVALKMAFRKFLADHAEVAAALSCKDAPELQVVGLQDSYHGDTLGAMDCGAPSPFNGPRQTPWEGGPLAAAYEAEIAAAMDAHVAAGAAVGRPVRLAALVMEPLVQGAGGMVLIDPLWQRAAARVARARGLPVVLDEVFAGLWRLGSVSAASRLGIVPDIACFAKLLTGGTVPLAATLATADVFDAFAGAAKTDALLHGHSYSGHAIGLSAAAAALEIYADPAANPALQQWR
ncbi:hypothetical protein WJX81_006165 [Elliptochloris bilobata]|uniref:Adenosylmethionine-8-amino-7-oxononanoate aminotransferase n=1 Tax=Elliptochloris bilobata TaxID=381761 RepID=A0AAW1R0Z8_9CHLO